MEFGEDATSFAEVATTTLPAGPPSTTATVTASWPPTTDAPTIVSPGLTKVLQSTHTEFDVAADTVAKQFKAKTIEIRERIAELGIKLEQAVYLNKESIMNGQNSSLYHTLSTSENIDRLEAIRIQDNKAYNKWDKFCCEALDSAKKYMSTEHNKRYRSVDTGVKEARRIIHYFGFAYFIIIVSLLISGVSVATIISTLATTATVSATAAIALPIALTGAAGAVYLGWKIYTNKELLIKIKHILVNYEMDFERYQPGLSNKFELDQMFTECVRKIVENLYEKEVFANDLTLPINPVCLCGKILIPKNVSTCYVGTYTYVLCDLCDNHIEDSDVFHCTNEFVSQHRQGYDICIKCARKHNSRLSRYSALIIQTLSQTGNIVCKDAEELTVLFKRLNYHTVITLQQNEATKDNVTKNLHQMSKQCLNDVVVVCFTGHGISNNSGFEFELKDNQVITDKEIYTCLISENSMKRDINTLLQESTFDLLLLINSCHSGGFRPPPIINERTLNMQDLFNEYLNLNLNASTETRNMIENLKESAADLPPGFDNYILEWFRIFDDVSNSAMVISSCQDNETSSFYGGISPFFRFIINIFTIRTDVTPTILYESLRSRTYEILPELQTNLDQLNQHVQQPYEFGHHAGATNLKPVVKHYH